MAVRLHSQLPEELFDVKAGVPQNAVNDLTANRSVKRDDDDSLLRMDELPVAAPLTLEHPTKPGHCTKEAAPVNLPG